MAHFRSRPVPVVRQDLHDHGGVPRAVAFVHDLLVVDRAAVAGRLLDGPHDIVIGHIGGLRLGDDIAELGVVGRVRPAAFLDRDRDLAPDLGKDLAALRVGLFLLILDIGPFGMS